MTILVTYPFKKRSISNFEWLKRLYNLKIKLSCEQVKVGINKLDDEELQEYISDASECLNQSIDQLLRWLTLSYMGDVEKDDDVQELFNEIISSLENKISKLSKSLDNPEKANKWIKHIIKLILAVDEVLPPLEFSTVLDEELDEIKGKQKNRQTIPVYRRAHDEHLLGLAFSGGGIRSATFNLGALQALSELNVLKKFNYLSTVSGGGYIGSWLASWIRHKGSVEEVSKELRPQRDKDKQEKREISFLREFSNYLTPKKGLLSVDTLTVAAMYIRNTSLNLLVLVLALLAILLSPRCLGPLLGRWSKENNTGSFLSNWPFLAAALLTLIALICLIASLRGRMEHHKGRMRKIIGTNLCVTLPLLLAAWFVTIWLWERHEWLWNERNLLENPWTWVLGSGAIYLVLWLLGWLIGGFWGQININTTESFTDNSSLKWSLKFKPQLDLEQLTGLRASAVIPSSFATGMFVGWLFYKSSGWFQELDRPLTLTIGLVVTLTIFFAGAVLHEGLSGKGFSEEARELWARLGGTLFYITIMLTGLFAISLYGPKLICYIASSYSGWGKWVISSGWVLTTISGILMGRKPGDNGGRVRLIIVGIAPYLFVLGLLLLLSYVVEILLNLELPHLWISQDPGVKTHWLWGLSWLYPIYALGAALLLSWRVGINEFSMHAMYRNRLCRCYLGASNPNRHEHPFTGFDPRDNIPLGALRKENVPNAKVISPFPLYNTTLNLVGGGRLAWQSRKAAAFVFNPLHCGFEYSTMSKQNGGPRTMQVCSAYRPTQKYGDNPSLATVMAISGAAASPNMGYYSSPALSFLMTMFNVRLGWWMANPLSTSWRNKSPSLGLFHLLRELGGRTNIRKGHVYLSDGGHFENLGIYELVRRRCRFIVAFDVEQDRDNKFKGLGNLIEKCRTDFGINININVNPIRNVDDNGYCSSHTAIGEIRYDKVDTNAPVGTLIYIKSSLTGDEPTDVLKYAANHPDFPHESTGDQWFDESQFESYRTLGYHVTDEVFKKAVQITDEFTKKNNREKSNETLLVDLTRQWYTPSKAIGIFAKHSPRLDRIHEMIHHDSNLAFMDAQIYPEWEALMDGCIPEFSPEYELPRDYTKMRAGFYICNQMLELMEGVYHDLNLEYDWKHPDNRGWMNLFKHWSASSMLNVTWSICAANFGARFQRFCEINLNLKMGRVVVEKTKDKNDLNSLEARIVDDFKKHFPKQNFDIYKMSLLTCNPHTESELFHYHFSFALTEGESLIFFRVQDHLRKLGLARRGLHALVDHKLFKEKSIFRINIKRVEEMHPNKLDPKHIRNFEDLFQSAMAEFEQQIEVIMASPE